MATAGNIHIPPDPGPAAWDAILPLRQPFAPLVQEQQADYLVIGAGFAGLSAARRLQQLQPEARIAVLEGRTVASGPSGRNSGFMIDLPHDLVSSDYAGQADVDRRQTAMNRAAIRFALAAQHECGMPAEAVDPCGKVNAAATEQGMAHNTAYARHLDALGETYQLLDAAAMRALTGVDYYRGGLWTPGTAMLQPALYVRGLAAGLQQAGVGIFEHSPVCALEPDGDDWKASTPAGSIRAGRVLLAVNGLIQRFGFMPGRLMHVFTYASMTRPLNPSEIRQLGGAESWSFTPADPMGSTVRRISGPGGARLVIRNRFTYDPAMEVSARRLDTVARDHQRAFRARFPMLGQVEMEYCWGGRLCLSLNGVAVIGALAPGLFAACCQNGLGAARGTVSGIAAAEQAAGATQTLLPDYQPEAAPRRLWPEPFMSVGANTYLRWKEWRAGREL
ncbi:MAG: FAD-binding oxidoreductase [Thiothrix sp.]|nr:FAD-binding oxidoreductase [Thiothrix sp.]HPE61195.1 FAD-binding oxidoreductase [Thiolinea sp.]